MTKLIICVALVVALVLATAAQARAVNYTLTVSKAGTGAGTVTSSPAGISCGSTCSASYRRNKVVTLTATPASGSTFAGYSGDCTGTSCTVTMSANKAVTATFNAIPPPPTPTGTLYFNSDFDTNAANPLAAYTATGGGREGWGTTSVVDDPKGVIEPNKSAVRKVAKFEVDYTDSGTDTCPRRSREQWHTGNNLNGYHPTFGSHYFMGGSTLLPADFPSQSPPDNGGGLPWLFSGMDTYASPFAGSSPAWAPKQVIESGARHGIPGDLTLSFEQNPASPYPIPHDQWIDMTYEVWQSSAVNVADGHIKIWANTGSGFVVVQDMPNVVTINSAMSSGTLLHYYPKIYYPSTLTAPAGWTDLCSSSGKTYFPQDPNGTYGWRGRVVTMWFANFKIGDTFDVVKPRTYE